MALRSAAAQAATLLRLRGRPAVTESLWVPLARRFSSTQFVSSNVQEGLHYSKDHEWVKVDGDVGTVGITDHAQINLGDIVFVELPKVEQAFEVDEPFGTVESVKAVSELFCPVSGTVSETNPELGDNPDTLNTDPYGEGWLIKLKLSNKSEVDKLMDAAAYTEFVKTTE